jgi:hypothetical protein
VRRRTPKFILFFDATSSIQMAHTLIMNYRAKISVILCPEIRELDPGNESILVYLLSHLVAHIKLYFLHYWVRTKALYPGDNFVEPSDSPLLAPPSLSNMC